MSFKREHPNYKSYKEPSGYYYHDVPYSAWTELESLIAEAGGAEGECLARIVAIIATKTRAGNVENSFAYENIQYVVSKLRQKVKDGKFDLFMDMLAMLCEEGDLTTDALNEFLADNKIGYIAIRMMRPQGVAWKKVGNDANNTEDEDVEVSENNTILLLHDAEVVKSKEGLKEAKKRMEEKQQRTGRDSIFISHRTADAMIAEMLLDYIAGCGIPKDRIFCSSIPGNDVDEKISSEVKQKLKRATIIILILSKDYYESAYCLNEAGVAWYLDEAKSIPIGLPEIDHSKMVGFLNEDYKLRRLDNDNDVAYIIDQTLERLNLNSVVRHGIITQETKKLIHRYRKYIEDRDVTPEKGGTHNKCTGEAEDDNRYTPIIGKDDVEYIPVEPAFLLVYAANGNGQIMRVQTLGAPIQVSADGKQFMADMSHRESARWVEALDTLVCWGWVKPVGNKGHVYELTGTGYQRAEWLKENMQINTENEPLEELKEFE